MNGKTPQEWCGRQYQSANRLAHLEWLRSLGVRTWFVHLAFVDDPIGPTDAEIWEAALDTVHHDLGLTGITVPNAGHVLLPADPRARPLVAQDDAPSL